jgi:phosphoribosylglycinamide formyltransferase-1
MSKFNLAILASGAGSTAEPLFDQATLIITNNPNAGIIKLAEEYRIDCIVLSRKDYYVYLPNGDIDQTASNVKYGLSILAAFRIYEINFVSQNGWSVMTPANVVNQFAGKIINSHPAPLDPGYPDFGGVGMHGLAVHAAVLNFKKMVGRPFNYTEVCLHQVTEQYDKGQAVAATLVPLADNDSPESLQLKVKLVEKVQNKNFWDQVKLTQTINPIHRTTRLILPGEEIILQEAKRLAILEYPKG